MISLALNMIVGPNDAQVLERCLKSLDAKNFFDEIVICLTSNDEEVRRVAEKYTDKLPRYEWGRDPEYPFGNFAAARNVALEATKSSFVWWTDADDVMPERIRKNMDTIKKYVDQSQLEFYFANYDLNFDEYDQAVEVTIRERIFRNRKDIRWTSPVHEQITELLEITPGKCGTAFLKNFVIDHRPLRVGVESTVRNLRIMEHEKQMGRMDKYLKYHYAKELLVHAYATNDSEREAKAIKCFEELIKEKGGTNDRLASICVLLARHYCRQHQYDRCQPRELQKANTYARLAISFIDVLAEPYVILGDIFAFQNKAVDAIPYYKKAMSKKFDSLTVQNVIYYEELPSRRLFDIYDLQGEKELALWYSRLVLKHAPNDLDILRQRQAILIALTQSNNDRVAECSKGGEDKA